MHPTQQLRFASFKEACRGKNLRLTPQRIDIFNELANAGDHPTAEIIHQRLLSKLPTLSLDTVYRTLATFARLDLISKVETVQSQARYEVTVERHHHLICENCQEIVDFQWPQIDEIALPEEVKQWGKVKKKNLVIYGRCRKCGG
ncbi:MAG: transcriptional repressor [Desulfuromonas sp.]|nr:transcriptional repressor [Desulfuromonas sp.]